MSIYAVGDIQGCFHELEQMLQLIKFDHQQDKLWFVGDLVNRGSGSLEVLRLVKSMGDSAITVLGNHDLHLLAVAAGVAELHHRRTCVTGRKNSAHRQYLLMTVALCVTLSLMVS